MLSTNTIFLEKAKKKKSLFKDQYINKSNSKHNM